MEKKNIIPKQEIGCKVHDCKFCDLECDCCNLRKIEVCNCNNIRTKEATMCNSYQKRKNI